MRNLMHKKIFFFSGKGGVGKTTCAAAFAVECAGRGNRTHMVSTHPVHSLGEIFGIVVNKPEQKLFDNLWITEIDPELESKNYISNLKNQMEKVVSPVIVEDLSRQIETARVSPGAEESAVFEKFLDVLDGTEEGYDILVFDTASTGQTLRLLSLPELLGKWIDNMIAKRKSVLKKFKMAGISNQKSGEKDLSDPVLETLMKRNERFEKARKILTDSGKVSFVLVLTLEKLSIMETKKAVNFLKKYGIFVDGVIVNRVLPENLSGDFWRERKKIEKFYLDEVRNEFGSKILAMIELMEKDIKGIESLSLVSKKFF